MVWSALCSCTRTDTNSRRGRVYFFGDFAVSCQPMPRSRLGTTDLYDGEADISALQRAAALRLSLSGQPSCCAKEDILRSAHHIHVSRVEKW